MFYLMKTAVYPEKSDILFEDNFESGDISRNWEISGGEWSIKDGRLEGRYRENGGGLIYSWRGFEGDIMLDFYGEIIPPCENDLNFSFRARGWDYEKNDADIGYIGGLNGWWTAKSGIERYPDCSLQAMTSAFRAESGREYHIQAGIIGTRCFIAVDGALVIDMNDPFPINAPNCGRVGLGTYCSRVKFRSFKVLRPYTEVHDLYYVPEF